MPLIIPATQTLAAGGYDIDNSCRFNAGDSPYMHWTPSGAGDSTEFTISFWYKVASVGSSVTRRTLFSAGPSVHNEFVIGHGYGGSGDQINIQGYISGSGNFEMATNRLHRDPSGWYHIVVAVDTSEGADADKCKLFINGTLETSFAVDQRSSMGASQLVNSAVRHEVGRFARVGGHYMDGYIAEFHSVDGTALDADDFGELDEDYGHWKPKEVDVTYGTNGFYLDFADSGDLGDDESGNGNDFTETNITASDQMTDTPTNNFCTMNSLNSDDVLSEGNLKCAVGGDEFVASTMAVPSTGKFYWEAYIKTRGTTTCNVGIISAEQIGHMNEGDVGGTYYQWANKGMRVYSADGNKAGSTSAAGQSSYGATYTSDDIIGIAVDMDAPSLTFYKNNSTQGVSHTDISLQTWIPLFGSFNAGDSIIIANWGQDGTFAGEKTAQGNADGNGYGNFYYAPPSSHLALCTKNLPDPTIEKPSEHFNTVLWSGNSTNRTIDSGLDDVDFVWLHTRVGADPHALTNTVVEDQAGTYYVRSHDTSAETTSTVIYRGISGGNFEIGTDTTVNSTGRNYVAWCWKAGTNQSSTATSGSGTNKTYTAGYNADAGFSIVSYTGNGTAGHTIPHHLGAKPDLMMVKQRNGTGSWTVYIDVNLMGAEKFMELHNNAAVQDSLVWNDTEPTSSVFTVGNHSDTNTNDDTYLAYCWRSIEGYSKVGYYKGNGNADGPFIYTGFRPQYTIVKGIDIAEGWAVLDSARDPYNAMTHAMQIDEDQPESISVLRASDHLSNGFRITTNDSHKNTNNKYYSYMAFAETPFKYANAR